MRRLFNDALISTVALAILLGALVSFDGRVRDQVFRSIQDVSVAGVGARLGDAASAVVVAARDRSLEHAALTVFVVGAVVLVVFMLRT